MSENGCCGKRRESEIPKTKSWKKAAEALEKAAGASQRMEVSLFVLVIVSIVLFGFSVLLVLPAKSADFYQWVSETGSLEFTDDIKMIPAKYADRIQERSWSELREKTNQKFTPVEVPYRTVVASAPIEADISEPVLEANAEEARAVCQKPIRNLPSYYRQVGDYTRTVYPRTDSCGRVVSETDSTAVVLIKP